MTTRRVAALVQARQFERAIREATAALATEPDSAVLWHLLALAQYGAHDHPAALESIGRALAAGVATADVFVHRGWILTALERPGEAVSAFEEALAVDPGHAEAHACLARLLVSGGALTTPAVHARALGHARRACELAPSATRSHLALATVLLAEPHREAARRAAEPVRAAIVLEPDSTEALRLRALVDLRRRHSVRAVRGYAEVLRLDPQDTVAAQNLALATWMLFARAHLVVLAMLATAALAAAAGGWVVRAAAAAVIAAAAWYVLVSRPHRAFPPPMRPAARRLLRRDALVRPYLAGIVWVAASALAAVLPWESPAVGRMLVVAGLFGYAVGVGAAHRRLRELRDRNDRQRRESWLEVAASLRG